MALNVGINGFGRIGRIIFRTCFQNPCVKVCAINDPAVDIEYICYLIKFDSTHGKFKGTVSRSDNEITIDNDKIVIFREKLPTNIQWHVADVQYVVEASGMFTSLEKASGHLTGEGVRRVLVAAPSPDVPMLVLGVNDNELAAGTKVISCASSTLYCLAPIIKILEDNFGVAEGFITSIHAMTPSLKPLDGLCLKGKHWRDHRSIHQNIIPATTGACKALGKIIPQVKDKLGGLAFRVPIVNVSVLDINVRLKSSTTINGIIKRIENARNLNMQNIIRVCNEQAVSSDFIGDTFSCILDADSSLQLSSDFFKLICWYENEYSYACRVIDTIFFLDRQYQFEWKSKISYIRNIPKQNLAQQIECNNFTTYHQACSYGCHSDTKSLCSTSQDSGFKSPMQKSFPKKNVPLRNFGTRLLPNTSRETKKNNELFKIWNDVDDVVKIPMRQNRGSFFHSCMAITPQLNTHTYVKTQERLQNVKKEFSKMVNMTENLLKQSQHSKIEIGLSDVPQNNVHETTVKTVNLPEKCNVPYDTSVNNNIRLKNDASKVTENQNNNKDIGGDTKNYKNIFSVYDDDAKISDKIQNSENSSSSCGRTNNKYYNLNPNLPVKDIIDNYNNKKSAGLNSLINNTEHTVIEDEQKYILKQDVTNEVEMCYSNKQIEVQNYCVDAIPIPLAEDNKAEISSTERNLLQKDYSINEQKSFSLSQQNISTPAIAIDNADKGKSNEDFDTVADDCDKENADNKDEQERNLQLRLEGILKKLATSSAVSEKASTCLSSINTVTTVSNRDNKIKQDIYDKLDSVSATDSENSFHMKERKSQVIDITDLTNSLEDLDKLDKICRIIEISDELSDQLLSALNINNCKEVQNKKWSFKDFCEKIKLDEFCNRIFYKNL